MPQPLNQYNKVITVNYCKKLKIYIIQAAPFISLARKQDYKIFAITIEDIKKALEPK